MNQTLFVLNQLVSNYPGHNADHVLPGFLHLFGRGVAKGGFCPRLYLVRVRCVQWSGRIFLRLWSDNEGSELVNRTCSWVVFVWRPQFETLVFFPHLSTFVAVLTAFTQRPLPSGK